MNGKTPVHTPFFINLEGKKIVIVGGGSVATRKMNNLAATGCMMVVVSPQVTPEISKLAEQNSAVVELRPYQPSDIEGAFLVIAATNSASLNAQIEADAQKAGALVNRADSVSSEVIVPSTLRRGGLQVAVSTTGASPSLSRLIRQKLEDVFDAPYEPYLDFLQELRARACSEISDPSTRRTLLMGLDHEAYLQRIRQGETLDATEELNRLLEEANA